jgi:hypothetical protein
MSDYTLTDLDTGEMIELTERQHTYFIRSARRETQKLNLALDSNANFLAENTKLLLEKSKLQKTLTKLTDANTYGNDVAELAYIALEEDK